MTQKTPITFQIYQGEKLVQTVGLAQDIIKVGKLPSSHLRIEDDNVSRVHAVIEVTSPDEVSIIDLGSASGTLVNGKKVNKARLTTGDEIVLGSTKIIIEIGEPEAATVDDELAPTQADSLPPSSATPPDSSIRNPFARPAPSSVAPPSGPAPVMVAPEPESVHYGIVASGPPVQTDEVETGDQAVEVVIMWGDASVLHVDHLNPPRTFYIGEPGPTQGVDYLVGSEVLGTERLPVVVGGAGGAAAVIPEGATGSVTVDGQTVTFAQLEQAGKLQPCSELPGAKQYGLPRDAIARVEFRGFTFLVKEVQAGKKVGFGFALAMSAIVAPILYVLGVMGVFGIMLTLMYFSPPSGHGLNIDLLDRDPRLVRYLLEPAETLIEETPDWLQDSNQDDREGGKGKRHKGDEGQMGKKQAKRTNNRYGIEGPEDNEDPHMAREEAREQARNAGILGTFRAMSGAWNSPTSPYGRDTALGNDPMSAMGAMFGDQIGENFGFGGLGVRGTGRGGGGTGEGTIGLGNLNTIGHGGGGGSGQGYGRGAGGFSGHTARVPQIRSGAADVRGSLSREVIRRVVGRHRNEVRFCYEQGLNQNPALEGRVTVRFVISPTGAVSSSAVGSSTLGDARVEGCVVSAVRRWTFPSPDGGGVVIVNYPFMLTASGG